jgi:chromosome segregation ATPase
LVLGSILGALLGAVIALGALSAINGGTLAYNTGQIRRDIATAQEVQSNLSSQLEEISGQLTEVNGRLDALATQSDDATQNLAAAQENITQLQNDVGQIESDFATVIEASQAVDEFLVAFRVMLQALPEGTTVEPTATP